MAAIGLQKRKSLYALILTRAVGKQHHAVLYRAPRLLSCLFIDSGFLRGTCLVCSFFFVSVHRLWCSASQLLATLKQTSLAAPNLWV